jgi:hypothetical protein
MAEPGDSPESLEARVVGVLAKSQAADNNFLKLGDKRCLP